MLAANGVPELVKELCFWTGETSGGISGMACGTFSLRILRFAGKSPGIIDLDTNIVVVFYDTFGVYYMLCASTFPPANLNET
jgi:hypothetical protein